MIAKRCTGFGLCAPIGVIQLQGRERVMDLSRLKELRTVYYSYELDRTPTELDARCGVIIAANWSSFEPFVVSYVTPQSLKFGEWLQGYYFATIEQALAKSYILMAAYLPASFADIGSERKFGYLTAHERLPEGVW